MDCPVCKYPNPPGATHCGMCYEVFNRSAAQAYLHAVQRERREKESPREEPEVVIRSEHVVREAKAAMTKVDWRELAENIASAFRKYWKILVYGAGLVAFWMLLSFLFSASLWYHLFGKKFLYAFSAKTPAQYLVSMKENVKIWSERQGRLDTPMEEFKTDEIGNVLFQKTTNKPLPSVQVRAREWIQISGDTAGTISHAIPKNNPSLAAARILFDKKGRVLERRYTASPRLAKGLPFLTPKFPKKSLRHGHTWDEEIAWLDVYDDWKIYWVGTLHWTLGELEPCAENTCAKLTYTADLKPRLHGGPSWAHGVVHGIEGQSSAEGQAFFDASHKRLVGNSFSYEGMLRIPIARLERIPWELRIGRGVRGPGAIAIRFENKIDVHKN
jgi:hypothetical protein